MEKHRVEHMDASTIGLKPGDPAYYGQLDVEYATRPDAQRGVHPPGHWSPRALHRQGQRLPRLHRPGPGRPPKWVFDNMTTGDVVQIVNTEGDYAKLRRRLGDWNIPCGPIRQLPTGWHLADA